MTAAGPAVLATTLAPVGEALLAAAHADADALLAAADAEAATAISAARVQVAEILAAARAEGAADAETVLAGERAGAHRRARVTLLRARRDAFQEIRDASRTAVRTLRGEPEYPRTLDAFAAAIRSELGPAASIAEDESGGMVADAGSRHVDYTLRGFVDRAVDALGAELEQWWAP